MVPCLVFTPPTTSTGGGGIHRHMHIIYAYIYIFFTFAHAHTTYIYTTYIHIYIYICITYTYIGTITISGGEGTTRRWATELYTHTWTVLEPHSFRSLWIFRCRPKNHLWAKSDGLQNQQVIDFWSLTTFSVQTPKNAAFGCPGINTHV